MGRSLSRSYKVAVVWRGDLQARRDADPQTCRLKAVFEALARRGLAAEPAVYCEEAAGEVRAQLLGADAVLVWVDPISTSDGRRREGLDALLREAVAAGVLVSAHPDTILKMGVKEVLYHTRGLGWGTDTRLYMTWDAFAAEFPGRLGVPRVIKQNRGNGGIGVWKVEALGGGQVQVQEGRSEAQPRTLPLVAFMDECRVYFEGGGRLIEQPYQARLPQGMIRCYMSGDRVVGFGRQIIRGLLPPELGPPGPRIMSGPDHPPFAALRGAMEGEWVPAMARLLEVDALPVIWDADFLYGPKTAAGADSYVLCEINVSSVFPIPDEAPEALAATLLERLRDRARAGPSFAFRFGAKAAKPQG